MRNRSVLRLIGRWVGCPLSGSAPVAIIRRSLSVFLEANASRNVVVTTDGDKDPATTMKFPEVWLRDNCRCGECFHQSSQSRRVNWDRFDTAVKALCLKADRNNRQIRIDWSDGHRSVYELDWLQDRDFGAQNRSNYLKSLYRPEPVHWSGDDFSRIVETFNFKDVMMNDEALRLWLQALAVYGVATIKDAPHEETVVRQLADRVGFIRRTTYGEEFIVKSKSDAKNYAYLSDPLPLHTDLPYYEYKPSVNILHCLVQSQSSGGSNLLVDAFHIADLMKAKHARDYEVLANTPVDWNDIGSEDGRSFHNIWRAPVICVDADGKYTRINHSVPQRDSHFSVALEKVLPWYEAYAKFVRLARLDAHTFKTQPGDVLSFNNVRLLHGRTGYDDTQANVRYIIGAYLDWDIIYSKLRVLKAVARQQCAHPTMADAGICATADTSMPLEEQRQ